MRQNNAGYRIIRRQKHPKGNMKIKYSPDADVLIIQLRRGKPVDSRDIAEGVIVHLSRKGTPLELEILDASRVVERKDVEVAVEELVTKAR